MVVAAANRRWCSVMESMVVVGVGVALVVLQPTMTTVTAFHVVWDSSSIQKGGGGGGGSRTTGNSQPNSSKRRPFSKSTTTNINPKHEQAKFPVDDTDRRTGAVAIGRLEESTPTPDAPLVVSESTTEGSKLPFLTPRATTPKDESLESVAAAAATWMEPTATTTTTTAEPISLVSLPSTALQRAIANGAVKETASPSSITTTTTNDNDDRTTTTTTPNLSTLSPPHIYSSQTQPPPWQPPQFNNRQQKRQKKTQMEAMQRLARQPLDTDAVPVLTFDAQVVVTALDALQQQQQQRARTTSGSTGRRSTDIDEPVMEQSTNNAEERLLGQTMEATIATTTSPSTPQNDVTAAATEAAVETTVVAVPPTTDTTATNNNNRRTDDALTEQLEALATEVDALMTQVGSIVATGPLESTMESVRLKDDDDDDDTIVESAVATILLASNGGAVMDLDNITAVQTTADLDDAKRQSETLLAAVDDFSEGVERSALDGFERAGLDELPSVLVEPSKVAVPDNDRNEINQVVDIEAGQMKGTEPQSNEASPFVDTTTVETIVALTEEKVSDTNSSTEEMTTLTDQAEFTNGNGFDTNGIQPEEDPSPMTASVETDTDTEPPVHVELFVTVEPPTSNVTALDVTDEITEREMNDGITEAIEESPELPPVEAPGTIDEELPPVEAPGTVDAMTEEIEEMPEGIELVTEEDFQVPEVIFAPSIAANESNESISMKDEQVVASMVTQNEASLSEAFRAAQASLLEKQQQQFSSVETIAAADTTLPAVTTALVEEAKAPIVVKTPEQLAQEADSALISLNVKQGVSEESIKGAAVAAFVLSTLAGNGLPVSIFLTVPVTAYLSVCRGLTGEIIRTVGAVSWNFTLFCTEYVAQLEFEPATAVTALETMTEMWQNLQESTRSVVTTSSAWIAEQNGKAREFRDRDFVARINLEAERMKEPAERKAERDAEKTSLYFASKPDQVDTMSRGGQEANAATRESRDSGSHEASDPPQPTIERHLDSPLQALRSVQESLYTVGVATSNWLQEQNANARELRDRDFVAKIDLDAERMRSPRKKSIVAPFDETDSSSTTTVVESKGVPEAASPVVAGDDTSARNDFYFTTVAPLPGEKSGDA